MRLAFGAPTLILATACMGYGALARALDFSLFHTLFLPFTMFALPAMLVLVDGLSRNLDPIVIALAVCVINIQLLPFTTSLMPLFITKKVSFGKKMLLAHFIAVTVWLEAQQFLPKLKANHQIPFYMGFCTLLFAACLSFGTIGWFGAGSVSPAVSSGLLMLTPVYFLLALLRRASIPIEGLAMVLGGIIGPCIMMVYPEIDLLSAGVIGGTIAFWVHR